MRPARVTSGEAFRSTVLVLAIVALVLASTGWLVLARTTAVLEDQVKARVTEDFKLLQEAQDRGGEQALAEFISWATKTRSATAFAFGMFTTTNVYVTGTLKQAPAFRGWGVIDMVWPASKRHDSLLVYAGDIGDHMLVVGRSLQEVRATGEAVLQVLAIAGFIIALTGLVTGYTFSRGTSLKLRTMARTLEQVSRGDSSIRLPIGHTNDQIDFVSRQINLYLDRLADLMVMMRNTAIAIAHDLKSPLNRVSILVQEAANSRDPEQVSVSLDKVQEEMDGLRATLDTILRISRIEASDDVSTFHPFDLPALLDDLVQTFEPVFEAQGQSIRYVPPSELISPVFGDRRMIQQLLVNLIENSGRYAGQGAVVELSAAQQDGAPVAMVADNGPGIPADKRGSVLEPFFRMNPERNAPGTGLGLAMVKAIATRHHATITLSDNAPGLRVSVAFPPPMA